MLSKKEREILMRQRAMEFFNNPENFEQDLSKDILSLLEEQLPDTHPSTIEKLHMGIIQLVENNTDYKQQ